MSIEQIELQYIQLSIAHCRFMIFWCFVVCIWVTIGTAVAILSIIDRERLLNRIETGYCKNENK
jgi:hypothetical protein